MKFGLDLKTEKAFREFAMRLRISHILD